MFAATIVRRRLLGQRCAKRSLVNAWLYYWRLDYVEFLCEHFIGRRDYDFLDY